MIRFFYKYAMNRYLGDILNNFVYDESIWMIFICVSMSIKMECYMFLFTEDTYEWEGLTPIPIFSIESLKSFTLLLFNLLQIHDTNNLSNKLLHIFLHLVNIILEILELFLVGSISVLKNNLLLLTRYTRRIKESS